MTKEKVKLILVIDASSSMSSTKKETVDAVESLLEEHKHLKDAKVRFQIYSFSSSVKTLVPITKLKEYEKGTFQNIYSPHGMTALYDAIGLAVVENRDDVKYSKTSLIILTDGQENASQEYTKTDIKELLTKVQDNLGWDVTYLGANMSNFDSYVDSIGIKFGKSIAFDPNQSGTRSTSLKSASTMSMSYMTKGSGNEDTTCQ